MVTVLMSDIRVATRPSPSTPTRASWPASSNAHRAAMNQAILGEGGTVMQFVGDAVMAVLRRAGPAARSRRPGVRGRDRDDRAQAELNARWARDGLPPFGLGIGLSTGEVAAALLGSEERLEYTLVGDTVNLAQRLQQLGRAPGRPCSPRRPVEALSGAGASSLPSPDGEGPRHVDGR